ncbi:PDZ domain-containing protein [Corynebacterium diphtheriae]|nr:PDZ domain-containing protein [Corynebacterium diphtheriae]
MASYLLGVVLFATGIAITIALHEWGHFMAARAFGMRVRRFFIGFGPTIASYRRGNTEYGFKAFPLGGFCDIAGMTNQDQVTPEEAPHAMMHKPSWQRIIVLLGGILMNILVGFVTLYFVACVVGLPNLKVDTTPVVGEVACVPSKQLDATTLSPCEGQGPAARAGIQTGDVIVAIDHKNVDSFAAVRSYVFDKPNQDLTFTIDRDGVRRDVVIRVQEVHRLSTNGDDLVAGAIGVSSAPLKNTVIQYNPVTAVSGAAVFSAHMVGATVEGLAQFPAKLPSVAAAIVGGERDHNSPMSVVGASRVGGELVQHSYWSSFFMMLASLNFFLALFNLIPLPPLDGGHIAVVIYEKLRDAFRKRRGLQPAGPADYTKLMPLTFAVAGLLLAVGALVIVADVVNPIRLLG